MKPWSQLQVFIKYDWRKKKNLIMYNHSFLPDFLCKEVFLVLIFLSEKSECYKFVIESRFNHISNSSSSPRR